ncbi:MAG: Sec-independent protein translocase protein TatB [Acidobacteriia bacterium]|nr:twin-arginine translocase subunit TatB [Methyloceanibacter sp.]MBX5471338.1 twin-arginine translocase subunit TatB [Acetobacteraceae bacterium]MCL6491668.1 Sec-independent protein translocase protein TatB [Terriglobia bacterium]
MFDFAWSEIALIGVVALIVIGPKDMPAAIKAVTDVIRKARRMAAEFQSHVDEMMREANLNEVREQLNEIRNFDLRAEVERTVDPDGSLRATFAENPLEGSVSPASPASVQGVPIPETAAISHSDYVASEPTPPEFIPPGSTPPATRQAAEQLPSFIPPSITRHA